MVLRSALSALTLVLGLSAALAAAETAAPTPAPVPAPAAAPATDGRLRGEVRSAGLRPVVGATAVAVRAEAPPVLALTATDTAGFIAVDGVPAGTWDLTVLAPGFAPGTVPRIAVGGPFRSVADITLKPGERAGAKLDLPRVDAPAGAGPALVLRVVGDGGDPLPGVRLRLEPLGRRADPLVAETSSTGEARLDGGGAGRWRVTLSRAGWTRVVVPDLGWNGGDLTVLARLLPLPENSPVPLEDLLPPPRLVTP